MEGNDKKRYGDFLSTKHEPERDPYGTINDDELALLEYELFEYPDLAQQILKHLHIRTLGDMPLGHYAPAVDRIRKIKQKMKESK